MREVKYLGLMIKYDCTWGLHWKYVKEKARRASFAVTRFGGRIRLNALAMVSIVKACSSKSDPVLWSAGVGTAKRSVLCKDG